MIGAPLRIIRVDCCVECPCHADLYSETTGKVTTHCRLVEGLPEIDVSLMQCHTPTWCPLREAAPVLVLGDTAVMDWHRDHGETEADEARAERGAT